MYNRGTAQQRVLHKNKKAEWRMFGHLSSTALADLAEWESDTCSPVGSCICLALNLSCRRMLTDGGAWKVINYTTFGVYICYIRRKMLTVYAKCIHTLEWAGQHFFFLQFNQGWVIWQFPYSKSPFTVCFWCNHIWSLEQHKYNLYVSTAQTQAYTLVSDLSTLSIFLQPQG